MNFNEVFQLFSNSHSGTDSFKLAMNQCEEIIYLRPDQASVCFFIKEYCSTYVLRFEDQEVQPGFAKNKHMELVGYMKVLDAALETQNSRTILDALDSVIILYTERKITE